MSAQGSGETRLSDLRRLCDAARQPHNSVLNGIFDDHSGCETCMAVQYLVAELDPSVVSALLDVAEAAAQVMDYDGATSAEDSVYGILAASLDALSQRWEAP